MAFSEPERAAIAARVRYELGYSAVTIAGEPYFTIAHAPEVALDALYSGASTTSATAVTSTSTPTTVTLASGTGFASGVRVHVDAGPRREIVVPQSVSGTSLTAMFSQPHSGTYLVEVESGESMLRTILAKLDVLHQTIASSFSSGGGALKKVDEVEWHPTTSGVTRFEALFDERDRWRDELGSLLKLPNLNGRGGGAARLEAY